MKLVTEHGELLPTITDPGLEVSVQLDTKGNDPTLYVRRTYQPSNTGVPDFTGAIRLYSFPYGIHADFGEIEIDYLAGTVTQEDIVHSLAESGVYALAFSLVRLVQGWDPDWPQS